MDETNCPDADEDAGKVELNELGAPLTAGFGLNALISARSREYEQRSLSGLHP
jgi:hypothetical protein